MTIEAKKFLKACDRWKNETDIDVESLETAELYRLHYQLDQFLTGLIEDRKANLALMIEEREGGDE